MGARRSLEALERADTSISSIGKFSGKTTPFTSSSSDPVPARDRQMCDNKTGGNSPETLMG
jgi:hypothetical protein